MELLLSFVVAFIFVLSAATKLSSNGRQEFRSTLAELGISPSRLDAIGISVTIIELVTALMIVIPSTRQLGVIFGLVLLLTFSAVAMWSRFKGLHVKCSCFGNISNQELGFATIIRNALIAILSVLILLASHFSLPALSTVETLLSLSLVTNVAIGIGFVRLLSEHGAALRALEGRPSNSSKEMYAAVDEIPEVKLTDPNSMAPIRIRDIIKSYENGSLIVFVSHRCQPCLTLLERLEPLCAKLPKTVGVILIGKGVDEPALLIEAAGDLSRLTTLLDTDNVLGVKLGIAGTPVAVRVSRDGLILGSLVVGERKISDLIVGWS